MGLALAGGLDGDERRRRRVRVCLRERDRGGDRGRGRERGGPGGRGGAEEMTRGVVVARRHRQAAWWRGELGRVRRVPPLPTGTRRKATGRRRWAGLLEELGQVSGPGGLPLSLSFLVSVFYFFLFCFDLVKILNHLNKC